MHVLSLLLVLAIRLSVLDEAPRGREAPTGRWSTIAAMNAPHEYHAAVAVEGKVYSVGGTGSVTLEEYDPKSNRWRVLPGVPTPRDFLGAAAIGKTIFAVGGSTRAKSAHGTVEAFDT